MSTCRMQRIHSFFTVGPATAVAIPLATLYGSLSSLYFVLPWLVREQGHSVLWTPALVIVLLALNIHAYFVTRQGPGYLPLGTRGPSEDHGGSFRILN